MKRKRFLYLILGYVFVGFLSADAAEPLSKETRGKITDMDYSASVCNSKIDLAESKRLALEFNSSLRVQENRVKAMGALKTQAGVLPNPELEVQMEQFSGTGVYENGEFLETTALLTQPIELGGKRKKRINAAAKEKQLEELRHESLRLEVERGVAEAFYEVLAAQERLKLARQMEEVAEDVDQSVQSLVEAGKISPVEAEKSSSELYNSRLVVEREVTAHANMLLKLSSFWGDPDPFFCEVNGDFYSIPPVTGYEEMAGRLPNSSDIKIRRAQKERADIMMENEKAAAIPDIGVGFGTRFHEATDDTSYLASISIPVPLFDQNRGKIKAAQLGTVSAKEEISAAEKIATAKLAQAFNRLSLARREINTISSRILPQSENVFTKTFEGYKSGKFGYLDTLDAERSLFKAKSDLIGAVLRYHLSVIELERIIGGPVIKSSESESISIGEDKHE